MSFYRSRRKACPASDSPDSYRENCGRPWVEHTSRIMPDFNMEFGQKRFTTPPMR
jgi:hypothetical protein